jgi:hypothetical protein
MNPLAFVETHKCYMELRGEFDGWWIAHDQEGWKVGHEKQTNISRCQSFSECIDAIRYEWDLEDAA